MVSLNEHFEGAAAGKIAKVMTELVKQLPMRQILKRQYKMRLDAGKDATGLKNSSGVLEVC